MNLILFYFFNVMCISYVLLKVRTPLPRLTPDEYEELSEWWRDSNAYFQGHPVAPPVIQPQANMDYEIPPAVAQKFDYYDEKIKEYQLKLDEIQKMVNSLTSISFELLYKYY